MWMPADLSTDIKFLFGQLWISGKIIVQSLFPPLTPFRILNITFCEFDHQTEPNINLDTVRAAQH